MKQYYLSCLKLQAKQEKYDNVKLTTEFSSQESNDGDGDELESVQKKVMIVKQ